jgi:Bacterial TSP3 repeat
VTRRLRDAAGQTFVEWLAVMAAVVALVGLVTVAGPARAIAAQASRLVCQVGGGDCASGAAHARAHARAGARRARIATTTAPPLGRAADVPPRGDADDDGLSDREERRLRTNPHRADSDGDGLTDAEELRRGTDPTRYDTDGDGYPDGWEVDHGRDPRHDERNPIQKIFDDVLDKPFDYLIPGGFVRGVARGALARAIRKIAPKLKDIRAVKTVREALALRRARTQAVQRLTRNKATGDAARDRIAATFPDSHVEVALDTPLGVRRIDVLTADLQAIESKVGRTAATKAIRRRVAKDVALRRLQPERVREVVWRFSTSRTTGRIGPTPALERLLRENHIGIVYDP